MEYIEEAEILLYEELCKKPIDVSDPVTKATILFRKNIKLVYSVVKKFSYPRDNAIDNDDILQCGYEGLWKACLNYDETLGYEFSTYAVPMIRGKILVMLRDTETIKTPRIFKDIRSTLSSHGFTLPLTDQELDILIQEGKFSKAQLLSYLDVDVASIDAEIPGTEELTLSDTLASPFNIGVEFSEDEIESIIDNIVAYIKPAYRDLIEEWMYAAFSGVKLSQMTLGKKYKKSQVQVSRVMTQAIRIVRMHREEILDMFGY